MSSSVAPLELLLSALASPARRDVTRALPDIDARTQRWWDEARAAHPDVTLPPDVFFGALAERLSETPEGKLMSWLEQLHPGDLYLAQACARGDAAALARFERLTGAALGGHARRFVSSRHSAEDLLQILREKLFVGAPERPPKILAYAAQGPLLNWTCVTALRAFLDCARGGVQQKREDLFDGERLEALMAPGDDLEIAFLEKKYRADFRVAFADALAELDSAERNLLRHHWVSGLTINQIGVVYHIHRATAARRLTRARASLMERTRRALRARLDVEPDDLDSIMDLISSRLDVSVLRLLGQQHSVTPAEMEPGS